MGRDEVVTAVLRGEDDADDAFAQLAEDVWKGATPLEPTCGSVGANAGNVAPGRWASGGARARCDVTENLPTMGLVDDKPTRTLGRRRSPVAAAEPADTEPRVAEDPEPPPLATDRYAGGSEIARGGMGRVVEATDTLLGRVVAVKQALATDPDALRRFARETRVTARLEHPSIVPVYDAGTSADGTPFYVMRKVSGQPLDKLLEARPALGERLALLPHVLAAAQAVAHAHERGVIHRDLKPSNILAGALGETVVIDWGLAKVIGETDESPATAREPADSLHTRHDVVLGTPGFMAPEQIDGADVGKRADVYALGATLYQLLAREPPHAVGSGTAVMAAARRGPPRPIATVVPGAPPELSTIVDKALAFDDAARYADAGAFAADLGRFLAGQLVAAHRYSRRERAWRFVRRHRISLAVTAAALAVIAVVGWQAIAQVVEARDVARDERRAAEQAREAETRRADEVSLAEARLLVDSDPAGAIALLRPLADGARWRDVRDIAATARARGVAWHLTGLGMLRALAFAPDGVRVAAAGEDDALHIVDVRARTTHRVPTAPTHVHAMYFEDDGHLLVVDADGQLARLDIATGARGAISVRQPIAFATSGAGGLAWIDAAQRLWRLAPGATEATAIEVPDPVHSVAIAPDGRLAIAGETALWIVDGAKPARRVVIGRAAVVAWDVDGSRLAAQLGGETIAVRLDHPDDVVSLDIRSSFALAFYKHRLVALTLAGVRSEDPQIRADFGPTGLGLGLGLARGDLLVAGINAEVVAFDGPRRQTLELPNPDFDGLVTSPRSPYVVAMSRGELYVWNLDDVFGHRTAVGDLSMVSIDAGGPHQLLLARPGKPSTWVDLATGATHDGPTFQGVVIGEPDPTGDAVLVRDLHAHTLTLAHRDRVDATPLGDHVRVVRFIGPHRYVAVTDSALELRDLDGHVTVLEASGTTRMVRATSDGAWLVALRDDGSAARIEVATGRVTPRPAPGGSTFNDVALDEDGQLWSFRDRTLERWTTRGDIVAVATLPEPVIALLGIARGRLVLDTADAGYVVDGGRPIKTVHLGTSGGGDTGDRLVQSADVVPQADLVAVPHRGGGALLVDVTTGYHWPIGPSGSDMSGIHLSRDGTILYEVTDTVTAWDIALPDSPAATAHSIGP